MRDVEYRLPQKRELLTALPGPKSIKLAQRRDASVPRAVTPGLSSYIVDADGGILVDADGNSLIDFASGIAVTTVGASNAKVVEAVREAVGRFTHTCFMTSPYESYVAVAEKLAELIPGDFKKTSILLNSGAEAVENAVKIARSYTGKNGVIIFDRAYHGRTNLTMAMTAKNKPYKSTFGPFASEVYRAPMSYPLRDRLKGEEAAKRAITKIEQEIGAENIACLVIEPVQGEGGFIAPAEGFLPGLQQWCNDNNVVFVADEVQAGFCRTGDWFAVNHENVIPDLVTTAKGVAGGMPLSAVTGRREIMEAPIPGGLGGTYGGNPVSCAAALASISEMERMDLSTRAREIEVIIREILEPLTELEEVAEIRGRGAMVAMELMTPTGEPNAELTSAVLNSCKEQGVLVLSCGLDGNVLRLLPSLTIPENLLREGLEIISQAIKDNN